jgi:uncharacterized protein
MTATRNQVETQGKHAWRQVCCALARERAHAEEAVAWGVAADAVPFCYRWEHVQQVVGLAQHLANAVGADRQVAEAAAWLHDICKVEPNHAERGAQEAVRILAETDFPTHKVPAVVAAIRQHEGLIRPAHAPPLEPVAAAVLWDADKLSKIGVQALAFSLSTHWMARKSLPERREQIEPFVHEVLSETVRSMNTAPAREMAQQRYRAMLQALEMWLEEENECTMVADVW